MADNIKPQEAGMNKRPRGSGFTNLSRFLEAGKDNRLGSTISGGVAGAGQQARGQLSSAQQGFQSQLQSSKIGDEDEKSLVTQGLEAAKQGQVSEEQAKGFERIRGGYKGPTALGNEEALSASALRAEQLGQNVQSRGGRQQLLQQFAAQGRPYSSGQQRLDEMLLGRTGAKDLQQARRQTAGVAGETAQAVQGARTQGQEAQNLARTFAEDVSKQLQERQQGVQQETQQALSEFTGGQQARQAAFDKLSSVLGKTQINLGPNAYAQEKAAIDEALQAGTLDPVQAAQLKTAIPKLAFYGQTVPLGFSAGDMPTSTADFMTPERAAQLNALARLGGGQANYQATARPLKQAATLYNDREVQKRINAAAADFANRFKIF